MARSDGDELQRMLEACPPAGSRYRHYKGGEYVVVGAAILEATREAAVLYRPTAGDGSSFVWVRSLAEWNSRVILGNVSLPRFQRLE
jgi:hypothetical protein